MCEWIFLRDRRRPEAVSLVSSVVSRHYTRVRMLWSSSIPQKNPLTLLLAALSGVTLSSNVAMVHPTRHLVTNRPNSVPSDFLKRGQVSMPSVGHASKE